MFDLPLGSQRTTHRLQPPHHCLSPAGGCCWSPSEKDVIIILLICCSLGFESKQAITAPYHQFVDFPTDSHKGEQIPYLLTNCPKNSPTGGCYSKLGISKAFFVCSFYPFVSFSVKYTSPPPLLLLQPSLHSNASCMSTCMLFNCQSCAWCFTVHVRKIPMSILSEMSLILPHLHTVFLHGDNFANQSQMKRENSDLNGVAAFPQGEQTG